MANKIRFRKYWGQHFLHDTKILNRIIDLASLPSNAEVIEIGPGQGTLTALLLERSCRVSAVEIDSRLCGELRERFSNRPEFRLIQGDAVKIDYQELIIKSEFHPPIAVLGNFPYNIGTHLIRLLLPRKVLCTVICCLLQEEVVRRIWATPGSRDYGYFSLFCQYFADITPGFVVRPGAFNPPPKVRSMTVRLALRPASILPRPKEQLFLNLLSDAFSHRRKTLIKNLTLADYDMEIIHQFVSRYSFSTNVRAEELHLDAFLDLSRMLSKYADNP